MAAWSRKTLKIFKNLFRLLGKTSSCGKIFKILFRKISSRHRWTCCVQISWNLSYEKSAKSVKSCVIYLTKNSPGSPAVITAWIAPKLCQGHPPTVHSECSRFHRNRFTFTMVTSDFRPEVEIWPFRACAVKIRNITLIYGRIAKIPAP